MQQRNQNILSRCVKLVACNFIPLRADTAGPRTRLEGSRNRRPPRLADCRAHLSSSAMCDDGGASPSDRASGMLNAACDSLCYFQAPQVVRIHGKHRWSLAHARPALQFTLHPCLTRARLTNESDFGRISYLVSRISYLVPFVPFVPSVKCRRHVPSPSRTSGIKLPIPFLRRPQVRRDEPRPAGLPGWLHHLPYRYAMPARPSRVTARVTAVRSLGSMPLALTTLPFTKNVSK